MTKLVGILNVTPDSFSDGGAYTTPEAIVARVRQMIDQGADVIDIGAESTRPGATLCSPEEEWARLAPCLPHVLALAGDHNIPVSLDTRHAATAEKAIASGVSWINDVSGWQDPAMLDVLARHDGPIVLMHSMGVPPSRDRTVPIDQDVIQCLMHWVKEKIQIMERYKIPLSRIIFDPGLGFGKTPQQNLQILVRWRELRILGLPILIGHSRKSLFSFAGHTPEERNGATLATSLFLMEQGVDYLRIHEPDKHVTLRQLLNG